jgi:hypothetical protein
LVLGAVLGGCPQPVQPGMTEPDGSGGAVESGDNSAANGDVNGNEDPEGDQGQSGGGGDSDSEAPQNVTESLDRLGVKTDPTPRVDESGDVLPEDYSPLGSECTVAQTDELFVAGLQLRFENPAGGFETLDNRAGFLELTDDATGELDLTFDLYEAGQTWEQDSDSPHPSMGGSTSGSQAGRAAAAGDIDGDGKDEIMIVYIADSAAAGTEKLFLVIADADDDVPTAAVSLGEFPGAEDIGLAAGDFDGDGDADLAIGVSLGATAELHVLLNDGGQFAFDESATMMFAPGIDGAELSLELAAGNIDRDNGHELVAVLNEYDAANSTGQARYWVFDDARAAYAMLAGDELVTGRDGQTYQALSASVALGDIDADGRDEIIFAGLTEFHNNGCDSYGHIHTVLQDAGDKQNPLGGIGARFIRDTYVESGTGCNSNSHQLRVRKVFVNAFDVDGDGIDEIQAGRRIFDDWTANEDQPAFNEMTLADGTPLELPYTEFLEPTETNGGVISDAACQVVTGDVTGDGREDVISYVQWRDEISVWALTGPDAATATWGKPMSIPTGFANGQTRIFPIIVPCNVDPDGLSLRYSEGEYRLVFTEPIIMAALAASPCQAGLNQNVDACRTTYGGAESQRAGVDGTVSVRASTWVGGDVEIFGFGASARETVTATASFSAGRAYELEQTIEYTTGPMEDTVICTTLPIDQYTYTVLSHPDPEMIGKQVVINMPRTPVTLQVEREFYNASTPADAFKVGGNVFLHTPGQIDTYPTEGDADALIDTGGLGHLGPLGELVDLAGEALGPIAERLLGRGLKSDRAVGVGATNGGESSIEIRFTESTDYRAGAEIDYEFEAEATAPGVVVGGSIGGSVEAGLSWGNSSSTIYRGTVGDISPDDFAGNGYRYGLFTYIYNYGDPSRQQFEVVNYWVER